MSAAAREEAARQAAIRTIASRERPVYRAMRAQDGHWEVLGCPWLSIEARDRLSAVEATRAAVAHWLSVEPATVDVEGG
jgi:hypothetical protein